MSPLPVRAAPLASPILIVALLPSIARAQDAPLWGSLTLSNAAAQESVRKLEAPRQYDDPRQRDVFQVKTVEVQPGELREEAPVGEYDQPLWTTFRRFPSTRVYLQTPPGGVQFEQWIEMRKPQGTQGGDETRLRQELEFGLGHRFQLDLYLREQHIRDGVNSTFELSGYSAELRYALADWNEIWGNPTLYFEYIFNDQNHDGADGIEPKILFGGEFASGWHWGTNFIHERTLAGHPDRVEEWSMTNSISRTVVDEVLSLGVTSELTYESAPGSPNREYSFEWLVGPSLQFLPHPRAALNLEPLWNLTNEGLRTKFYIVFSWHF